MYKPQEINTLFRMKCQRQKIPKVLIGSGFTIPQEATSLIECLLIDKTCNRILKLEF